MKAIAILAVSAAMLAGCATTARTAPVEVTRYHINGAAQRGTIAVEPLPGGSAASIEYKTYAAAVQGELLRLGYTAAAPGARAENLAVVSFRRANTALPPRRSPVSIGIGGGGFSGGRGGGLGLGGGVGFPVGGGGAREAIATELTVQIRRGPDAVWEGSAQTVTDIRAAEATADQIAGRLAGALFQGFPGESGRTIAVP